jgi:hypothetical protein
MLASQFRSFRGRKPHEDIAKFAHHHFARHKAARRQISLTFGKGPKPFGRGDGGGWDVVHTDRVGASRRGFHRDLCRSAVWHLTAAHHARRQSALGMPLFRRLVHHSALQPIDSLIRSATVRTLTGGNHPPRGCSGPLAVNVQPRVR